MVARSQFSLPSPGALNRGTGHAATGTHHDVIRRVVCWAPSILVAVWAVEYPAVLSEETDVAACVQTGGVHANTDRSHTHVNAGIRADEVCHGQRALLGGVYQPRSVHNLISRPLLTFPIIARPSPPFGAHSSFATRSSLFARIARHRVVTLTPWLFVSVCVRAGQLRQHGDMRSGAAGGAPGIGRGCHSCQTAGSGGGPGTSRIALRYRSSP